MRDDVLRLSAVTKVLPNGRRLFDGLDLALAAGEHVAVRGESGVGKSTLLNLIAGLDTADGGEVAVGGRSLAGLDEAAEIRDPRPDAFAGLEAAEGIRRLRDCLDELEARQRDAIRAAFFGGFSYVELAEAGAVPLGTMKSWVRRGLIRLKACLGA